MPTYTQSPGNGMRNTFWQEPYGTPYPNPNMHIGIQSTASVSPNRRITFAERIIQKYPFGSVQLLPLLNASRGTTNALSESYAVNRHFFPTLVVAEDVPPATRGQSQSMKVRTTNGVIPNMMFVTGPLGEQIMITDNLGSSELVIIRGLSSTMEGTIKAGTRLIWSGDAFEEASLRPLMRHSGPGQEFVVHTQIFRHSWGVTGSMREILYQRDANAGGYTDVASESKEQAMKNHALSIEQFLLFGKKSFTSMNNMPLRTGSGVLEFISSCAPQNIITCATDLNVSLLGKLFDSTNDVGSAVDMMNPNKPVYCGRNFIDLITEIAANQGVPMYTVNQQTDILGRQYTNFKTATATYTLHHHPIFDYYSAMRDAALILDSGSFAVKYLGSRDTQHQYYNQDAKGGLSPIASDNGIDASGGTFLTELMLVCRNPAANALIYNVNKAKPVMHYMHAQSECV